MTRVLSCICTALHRDHDPICRRFQHMSPFTFGASFGFRESYDLLLALLLVLAKAAIPAFDQLLVSFCHCLQVLVFVCKTPFTLLDSYALVLVCAELIHFSCGANLDFNFV